MTITSRYPSVAPSSNRISPRPFRSASISTSAHHSSQIPLLSTQQQGQRQGDALANSSSNRNRNSKTFLKHDASSLAAAPLPFLTASAAAAASLLLLLGGPVPCAHALPPPDNSDPDRCSISAFDKFASTRAKFSMEASQGGMAEALVDVRDCNFKGADLDGKVLSGALMNGADCEGCTIRRAEISRADLRSAQLQGAVFEDSNLYGSQLGGADLRGATFENAILSNVSFGKDERGQWAQLEGAHFEGALLSSSDIERLCANPTIDLDVRKYELGCRSSK